MQVAHPVAGYGARRSGSGLIDWMTVRPGKLRTVNGVVGLEVPEPVLAGLEALHDAMAGGAPVGARMLAR